MPGIQSPDCACRPAYAWAEDQFPNRALKLLPICRCRISLIETFLRFKVSQKQFLHKKDSSEKTRDIYVLFVVFVVFAGNFEGIPSRLPSNFFTSDKFEAEFEGVPSSLPSKSIRQISIKCAKKSCPASFPKSKKTGAVSDNPCKSE